MRYFSVVIFILLVACSKKESSQAEVNPSPEPAHKPSYKPEPIPKQIPRQAPKPEPIPRPTPLLAPKSEPIPEPVSEVIPALLVEPETTLEANSVPKPKQKPEPEPEPEPIIAITGQKCIDRYVAETDRSLRHFTQIERSCWTTEAGQREALEIIHGLQLALGKEQIGEIQERYQKLQELLIFCRTQQILNYSNDKVPDDRLFLHILGDIFGKSSGLEGYTQKLTIPYRTRMLEQIQKSLAGKVFIADSKQSDPCGQGGQVAQPDISQDLLTKLIDQSKNAEKLMTVFDGAELVETQKLFKEQIDGLKSGESLFLPAGWSGHGVIYEITKDSEETGRFRVFNSGDGIGGYHFRATVGYKTQFFPFVEVIDIPLERITSLAFLRALQFIEKPGVAQSNPAYLYEKALKILGGKPNPKAYDASLLKDDQRAGTCSYFPTAWLLESSVARMSKEAFNQNVPSQIEFLIGLKSLKAFSLQSRAWADPQIELLRKGLVYFSESSARGYQDGLLSYGNLMALRDVGAESTKVIEKASEQLIAQKVGLFPKFSFDTAGTIPYSPVSVRSRKKDKYPIQNEKQSLTTGSIFNLNDDLLSIYRTFYDYTFSGTEKRIEPIQVCSGFRKRELDPSCFQEPTDEQKKYDNIKALEVFYSIEDLALTLPLSKEYWAEKGHQRSVEALAHLSKLYFFIYLQNKSGKFNPVNYLVNLKLLTVADLINQEFLKSIHPAIPSMFQPRAWKILSGEISFFDVSDPMWQQQILLMRSYYASRQAQELSFFGFENYDNLGNQGCKLGEQKVLIDDREVFKTVSGCGVNQQNFKKWPDLIWAKDWLHKNNSRWELDSSAIKPLTYSCPVDCQPTSEMPNKERKNLADVTATRQAILALDSGGPLPEEFYQLRVLSNICNLFMTQEKSLEPLRYRFNLGLKTTLVPSEAKEHAAQTSSYSCQCINSSQSAIEKTNFNVYQEHLSVFGVKSSGDSSPESYRLFAEFNTANQKFAPFEFRREQPPLLDIWSLGFNEDGTFAWRQYGERYRISENEYILKHPADKTSSGRDFKSFSLERLRDLLGTSSNPELQIISTLDFYTKHPELLIQKEYQIFFEKLMMEPGLFLKELSVSIEDSTQFVQSLKTFCDSKYLIFSAYHDVETMAFILHMKQLFYAQVVFASTQPDSKIPESLISELAGAPQKLFKLLEQSAGEDLNRKNFLYEKLAEMFLYSNSLSEDDVVMLLTAVIQVNASPNHDKSRLRNILIQKRNLIEFVLSTANRDEILNKVLGYVEPSLKETSLEWKLEDGYYSARLGSEELQFNVLTGYFYRSNLSRVPFSMPKRTVEEIFGKHWEAPDYALVRKLNNVNGVIKAEWTWTWKNGSKARISSESWMKTDFYEESAQQEFDGKWYNFFNPDQLDENLRFSGYSYWILEPEIVGEKERCDGQRCRQYPVYSDQGSVILVNKDSGKIDYKINLKEKEKGRYYDEVAYNLLSFTRLIDGAELANLGETSGYRVFSKLSEPVHVWIDPQTKTVREVEIPKLKLEFKAEGSELNCLSDSDYKVSETQYVPELGIPANYLVCESKEEPSHKRVLIPPDRPIAPKKSLSTEFSTELRADHVLVYDITPKRGLVAETEESRYYLALRKLFQRRYKEAAEVIRDTSIELKPLKGEDEKVVSWIFEGNPEDHDPRSYAVRLLAMFWKLKQNQYYNGDFILENIELKLLSELYHQYLGKADKLSSEILHPEEELKLAKAIRSSGKEILARISMLESQDYQAKYNLEGQPFTSEEPSSLSETGIGFLTPGNRGLIQSLFSGDETAYGSVRQKAIDLLEDALKLPKDSLQNASREELKAEFSILFRQDHERLVSGVNALLKDEQNIKLYTKQKEALNKLEEIFIFDGSWDKPIQNLEIGEYKKQFTPLIPLTVEASSQIQNANEALLQAAADDPLRKPILSEATLNKALHIAKLSVEERSQISKQSNLLQNALNRSDNKAVQNLKNRIKEYAQATENNKRVYGTPKWELLKIQGLNAVEQEKQKLEQEIKIDAKRYAPDVLGGAFNQILHLADIGKPLNLDDMIYMLLKRERLTFYGDLNLVYQKLVRYLLLSTYLQHDPSGWILEISRV